MSNAAQKFPATGRYDPDLKRHVMVQTIECCVCGKTAESIGAHGNTLAVSPLSKRFRTMGWYVGSRRNQDRCPEHASTKAGKAEKELAKSTAPKRERPYETARVATAMAVGLDKMAEPGLLALAEPQTEVLSAVTRAMKPHESDLITKLAEKVKAPEPEPVKRAKTGTVAGDTGTGYTKAWNAQRAAKTAGIPADLIEVFPEPGGTYGWKRRQPTPSISMAAARAEAPTAPEPTPAPAPIIESVAPAAPLESAPMTDTATPPRPFTRDERRKALDGLETAYDADRNRYRGNGSDEVLAARLNLPRALVTEVREQFFGPDVNEAGDLARKALADLKADAEKLAERHLALAADAEALAKRAAKALGEA